VARTEPEPQLELVARSTLRREAERFEDRRDHARTMPGMTRKHTEIPNHAPLVWVTLPLTLPSSSVADCWPMAAISPDTYVPPPSWAPAPMRKVAPGERAFAVQTAASHRPRSVGIPVCAQHAAFKPSIPHL
jgi:hypothetical protein